MTDPQNLDRNPDSELALQNLPKGALQAIYHAVTGKTESLSRDLSGNVICTTADLDRLQGMLLDQFDIYPKEVGPTTTIVVKTADDQAITYSSWERFKVLRVDAHDITSEVIIKNESIFRLPNTPTPQRCIVNITIDSSLPLISKTKEEDDDDAEGFIYFLAIRPNWKTVSIKIDL